jgi:uncharacterized membrane protein YbhN (UPF0104 family)
MAGAAARPYRRWAIRAAGSALFLGALFWFLPREAIIDGFSRITLPLFLTVLAVFLAGHVLAAAKWWMLLDRSFPFAVALRAHFAGLAANLCLPGAAGGDAVRAGVAHLTLRDGPRMAAGAVADRLIDMVALAFLTLGALAWLRGVGTGGIEMALGAGVAMFVLLLAAIYAFPAVARLMVDRVASLPAKGLILRMADAFAALGRRPGRMVMCLCLSIGIQATFVWLSARLGYAVGMTVPLAVWFFAWPLAKIISVLPISLGGLGVRESSLAALMVPYGAVAAQVVASGLVWQAVLWTAGGLGGLVLLLSGGAGRRNGDAAATGTTE